MKKSKGIPEEFGDVAYQGDINAVHARIDKCYSSESYKNFQDAVEEIIGRYLKGNVGWVIALWIISLLGSMIAEKVLHIF